MKYKVIVVLREEDRRANLVEACKSLISRVKSLIDDGVQPSLLENSCMLQTEIDDRIISLEMPTVIELSKRIGILDPEDGFFIRNPPANMSEENERKVIKEVGEIKWVRTRG